MSILMDLLIYMAIYIFQILKIKMNDINFLNCKKIQQVIAIINF
jgi:hypothetical protein